MPAQKQDLILGSASPRRQEILRRKGLHFTVMPSSFNEQTMIKEMQQLSGWRKRFFYQKRVKKKMEEIVFYKYKNLAPQVNGAAVLCFDTLVCDNRGCLGKPANETEALGMLRRLNNKNHFVHTACLFHCDSCIIIKTYTTRVSFKNNPDSVLHNYIAKVDVTDAAGAYKIQDNGDMLIKKIKGSYSNVVGLPEIFLKYTGILLC